MSRGDRRLDRSEGAVSVPGGGLRCTVDSGVSEPEATSFKVRRVPQCPCRNWFAAAAGTWRTSGPSQCDICLQAASVRRGSTLKRRRGRHQTGCGERRSVATSSEAITAARRSNDNKDDLRSPIGAPGSIAGGTDRTDPVSLPKIGTTHPGRIPALPRRYRAARARATTLLGFASPSTPHAPEPVRKANDGNAVAVMRTACGAARQ